LAVGVAAGIAALQFAEDGFSLQPGIDLEQGEQLGPDVGEGVGPRPPGMGGGDFAGKLAELNILPGGLRIHAGHQSTAGQGTPGRPEAKQLLHLSIGHHRKPPFAEDLRQIPRRPGREI
jgi:hypothetical protein